MNRTEKKKQATRKKIIDSAIYLIGEKGYNETTMEEIAKIADIAKGTLYNYYSIKEEIVSDMIRLSFEDNNDNRLEEIKTLKSTEKRLVFIFTSLLEGITRQKDLFEKYIIFQMQQLVSFSTKKDESGMGDLLNEVICLGKETKEIREELPSTIISELIIFAFIETVKDFYENSRESVNEEIMKRNIGIVLRGVKP